MHLILSLVKLDRDEVLTKLIEGTFPKAFALELDVIKQEYEVTPGTYVLVITDEGTVSFRPWIEE